MDEFSLSARAYTRILNPARRLPFYGADLAATESVEPSHVAEAIQYRKLDRGAG